MDGAAFGFLLTEAGQGLLRETEAAYDGSNALAVTATLRARHDRERVAAAVTQVELRRRASVRFGSDAATLYFTPDGLEQATHPSVARHRAGRLRDAVPTGSVIDLGCGIGSDLMAFADAGYDVVGVERDPVTAAVARANLAGRGAVVVDDAESVYRAVHDVAFLDPARRGATGRTFDPAAYSPPWRFVEEVLTAPAIVKVAPGIPHSLVPAGVEAEWVSLDGTLREAALWSVGADVDTDRVRTRATVLRSSGDHASMTDRDQATTPRTGPPGRFVYEPDDAVIRAHLVTTVCAAVDGWLLDEHLAYVSSDRQVATPFARAFAVREVLPFQEKRLKAALRARDIGPVTIKKRGVQVTPEQLRGRLGLTGSTPATLMLSRTPGRAVALLVEPL